MASMGFSSLIINPLDAFMCFDGSCQVLPLREVHRLWHTGQHSVYDVTIGYKYCCPSFLDNVFWVDPSEAHIHIRSFPLDRIPESEDEISMYLIDRF